MHLFTISTPNSMCGYYFILLSHPPIHMKFVNGGITRFPNIAKPTCFFMANHKQVRFFFTNLFHMHGIVKLNLLKKVKRSIYKIVLGPAGYKRDPYFSTRLLTTILSIL